MNKKNILTSFLLLNSASILVGQTPPPAPEASAASPQVEVEMIMPDNSITPLVSSDEPGNETISIDFPNEEIRTVLRSVADLYDLNLVIPEELVGTTTIKLKNVTWRQVFSVVLEPVGYTFLEEDNIVKVRSVLDLAQEPTVTDVFIINYSSASSMKNSLQPFIDTANGGRIEVNERANALIVTERPSKIADLRKILASLEQPTSQVMIESKFVDVTNRDERNIGINWASLSGYQVGVGGLTRSYNGAITRETDFTRARAVDNPDFEVDAFNRISNVSNRTNLVGQNVRVGPGFTESAGNITIDNGTKAAFTSTPVDTSVAYAKNNLSTLTNTAVFSADDFNVVLSALETENDIKLVSNPTVVTMHNQEAKISVGDEFPLPNYQRNSETGELEVSGFEYKPIGINLTVTPSVNNAGMINLDIVPEVSSQNGFIQFDGTDIPIVATRKTESNVIIKDGYTLAIGGLIENDNRQTKNKVPVLGSIPVLGRLFSSDNLSENQRNLLIFVTAKILNPDGTDYRETVSVQQINDMKLTPNDIPGYQLPDDLAKSVETVYELRGKAFVEKMRSELQEEKQPRNKKGKR